MKKNLTLFSASMLLFSQLLLPIVSYAENSSIAPETTEATSADTDQTDQASSREAETTDTSTDTTDSVEQSTKTAEPLADDSSIDSWMPDKNLQAIIATSLGKTDFTQEDMQSITSLSIDHASITTFKGAEYATNLTHISITNTDLSATDMANVSSLSNLQEAILTNDNLSDASFIFDNKLTSLTKVDVSSNKFTNLNSLKGMTMPSLTNLNISHNQLSDISIIQNVDVPNLTILDASYNLISDVSAITNSTLTGLTNLDVSYNQIADISPIENTTLTNLTDLNASHNMITDISPIANSTMANIVNLNASYNDIQDVNAFANSTFTKLETLDVTSNQISDISVMKNLTDRYPNLHTYKVDNNKINSIEFMEGYQLNSDTSAQNQIYEKTISIIKPSNTELTPYEIAVPITSLDYQYDSTSGYYIGLPDPTAETLTLSNIIGATALNYTDGTSEAIEDNAWGHNKVKSFVVDASKTTLPTSLSFSWNGAQGQYSGNATIHINWVDPKEPVIEAQDQTILVGESFKPEDFATAYDQQDDGSARTDLTSNIEVLSNTVDSSKPGKYTVSYSVTNAYGLQSTKTITVTVKAAANSYSISFNANGGTGTMTDLSMVYGKEQNLSKNTFTKDGYTFKGWATTPNGAVVYQDQQAVKDLTNEEKATITLYAVWEKTAGSKTDPVTPTGSGTTSNSSNSKSTLPSTGEKNSGWLTSLGLGLLLALAVRFIWKRKQLND